MLYLPGEVDDRRATIFMTGALCTQPAQVFQSRLALGVIQSFLNDLQRRDAAEIRYVLEVCDNLGQPAWRSDAGDCWSTSPPAGSRATGARFSGFVGSGGRPRPLCRWGDQRDQFAAVAEALRVRAP